MRKMGLVAAIIRLIYRLFCCFPVQDKICMLSKHAACPLQFRLMAERLQAADPRRKVVIVGVSSNNHFTPGVVLRQLWHSATSRVCIVDSYIPAVCIPKAHPRTVVVQSWHAGGAIKQFGYQSLGTASGRSSAAAETLRMHRGYDYAVSASTRSTEAFAQAFDMPVERIVTLGSPTFDYVTDERFAAERLRKRSRAFAAAGVQPEAFAHPVVLYAPTFRKGIGERYFIPDAAHEVLEGFRTFPGTLLFCAHPGTNGANALPRAACDAGAGNVITLEGGSSRNFLEAADVVVTDYSALAFEAAALGKPIAFYVPDIEEYRESPGLNIDPLASFPQASFTGIKALQRAIAEGDPALAAVADQLEPCPHKGDGRNTQRVCDFVEGLYRKAKGCGKGPGESDGLRMTDALDASERR